MQALRNHGSDSIYLRPRSQCHHLGCELRPAPIAGFLSLGDGEAVFIDSVVGSSREDAPASGLPSARRRYQCRAEWPCGWLRHRDCRRRWRSVYENPAPFLLPRVFETFDMIEKDAILMDPKPVRASSQQPRLFIGMVLILIFAEVLGLYGVIVGILMLTKSKENVTQCLY